MGIPVNTEDSASYGKLDNYLAICSADHSIQIETIYTAEKDFSCFLSHTHSRLILNLKSFIQNYSPAYSPYWEPA